MCSIPAFFRMTLVRWGPNNDAQIRQQRKPIDSALRVACCCCCLAAAAAAPMQDT